MIRINKESELIERLQKDVVSCGKELVVLQSGHFPIMYLLEGAIEGVSHWGQFSTYSLELGCKIGLYAKERGKKLRFVFFADDHSYESMSNLTPAQVKTRRNKLYKEKSGINAVLSPEYQKIMNSFGFDESYILRQNHGKSGREDCLYFSEKILRASSREIENTCAREYTEFIEDPKYFDKDKTHLISFVPNRCMGHICQVALDQEIKGISASHIFMETMTPFANREELYGQARGVTYRRDFNENLSI